MLKPIRSSRSEAPAHVVSVTWVVYKSCCYSPMCILPVTQQQSTEHITCRSSATASKVHEHQPHQLFQFVPTSRAQRASLQQLFFHACYVTRHPFCLSLLRVPILDCPSNRNMAPVSKLRVQAATAAKVCATRAVPEGSSCIASAFSEREAGPRTYRQSICSNESHAS